MQRLLNCLFLVCIAYAGLAQEKTAVVINPTKQNEEELYKTMYRYPEFTKGKAHFKNGGITESRFNYNYLTNRVLFIDLKGDTLELAEGENFDKITIQSDTFCFYKKEFLRQLSHTPSYNLFIKTSLHYNGSEKKGAYGGYSATSATTSVSQVNVNSGSGYNKLLSDENITYTFSHFYCISGKYGKFYPATKKGFYEAFAKNEKEMKEFIESNKIDFGKEEDLEKLLNYGRSIVK
jgi:hypothetical protein